MADKDNLYMHEQVAKHGTKPSNGKVLALFPTGQARRYAGTFFVMNYRRGERSYQCPAVLLKDNSPLSLDPRAFVFDDGNLAAFWHPRLSPAVPDPKIAEWLEANPGYAAVSAAAEPSSPRTDPAVN